MDTLTTEYGAVSFTDEVITVDDKPYRNSMRMMTLVSFMGALMSLGFFWKTDWAIDQLSYGFWLGCLIVNLISGILSLRFTNAETILVDDIKTMKLCTRFENKYVDIKLKNGRLRRVAGLGAGYSRIKAYITANFPA